MGEKGVGEWSRLGEGDAKWTVAGYNVTCSKTNSIIYSTWMSSAIVRGLMEGWVLDVYYFVWQLTLSVIYNLFQSK